MTAHDRKARWKERQKNKVGCLTVPLVDKYGLIDAMIEANEISPQASESARLAGDALGRIIAPWLAEWRKKVRTRST